jgi:DNA invertase Pin-like site-specific DNA recombinase
MNKITPRIAAAYVRQSAHHKTMSSFEQTAEIKKAAEKHGITLLQEFVFTDENAGTTQHREGFEALKKAATDGTLQKRGVNTLLFYSTDRITRNLRDLVSFEAEMARSGITCLSAVALCAEEVLS